jgi:hypothetical protein
MQGHRYYHPSMGRFRTRNPIPDGGYACSRTDATSLADSKSPGQILGRLLQQRPEASDASEAETAFRRSASSLAKKRTGLGCKTLM